MKSINKNVVNEIIINKSRFITKLIKINNEDEIKIKLDYIKKEYKDATHYCYAYITGNTKRFNDETKKNVSIICKLRLGAIRHVRLSGQVFPG